jgi:hypothetical protein
MTGTGLKDWIEQFLDYTSGINSPDIFRQWAGIATIAGALERRVWIMAAGKQLFPNLYTLLVSAPGIGKTQAIEHTSDLWYAIKELHVAPHDVTKASLVDAIAASSRKLVLSDTSLIEYNSLLIAADEFGVLVPSHDQEFLNTLNRIYDNPPQHRQNRRGFKDQIDITNPQLNIIGGTQPAYLANLLPEQAWGMGFMSRIIMIHCGTRRQVRLFGGKQLSDTTRQSLIRRLQAMGKLYGAMPWEFRAAEAAEHWNLKGLEPVPTHSKMEHYNARRMLHVLKLSIVSAVSQGNTSISVEDFNRGRDWLLEAESAMPDIFRAMVQRSDIEVIDELHFYAWQVYIKDKKPIHESKLINFLQGRVPSEKIVRILDICTRAGNFTKLDGTGLYQPMPKTSHGVE